MSSAYAKGSVAVVGCGWLGFALAQNLLDAGYTVYGTTTNAAKVPQLRTAGISASLMRLSPKPVFDAIRTPSYDNSACWRANQLVLNVPPGRGAEARTTYPAQILSAVLAYRRAQTAGRIVFCSSTGVYGDLHGTVDELTPLRSPTPRAVMLALAESQITAQSQRPHVILRLGGLYGDERHPGKVLAGRRGIPDGDAPTNLVSRQRVIERIRHYLDAPFWSSAAHVENVVDPNHPTKRELYVGYARQHGLPEPHFAPGGKGSRVVVSTSADAGESS